MMMMQANTIFGLKNRDTIPLSKHRRIERMFCSGKKRRISRALQGEGYDKVENE